MRSIRTGAALALALFSSVSLPAFAALRQSYFGATRPGACSNYSLNDKVAGRANYTYCRLADQGGSQMMEVSVEFLASNYGTKNRYTLKPGYSLEQNALDYLRATTALTMTVPGAKPMPMTADMLAGMIRQTPEYAPAMTFKGTENVGDHRCDRYAYRLERPGTGMKESGEMWLDATVPFGIVKQAMTTTDKSGKVVSDFEMILVSTSSAALPKSARGAAATPGHPEAAAMSLRDAFRKGAIGIRVHVVEGTKQGERVQLTISNKGEAPLTVIIPKGATSMEVGMPLDTFTVEADAERKLVIPGSGAAPPFEMRQKGTKRAFEGTFNISTYEGTPLFDGNVTTGFVK